MSSDSSILSRFTHTTGYSAALAQNSSVRFSTGTCVCASSSTICPSRSSLSCANSCAISISFGCCETCPEFPKQSWRRSAVVTSTALQMRASLNSAPSYSTTFFGSAT